MYHFRSLRIQFGPQSLEIRLVFITSVIRNQSTRHTSVKQDFTRRIHARVMHSLSLFNSYIASKWNGWVSWSFSIWSIWRSLTWRIKMMIVITMHVAPNEMTLIQINLLGVTNNCAFHWLGSSGGHGTTTIWEFGISCVHVRFRPDNPTVNESKKFAVRPIKRRFH